jgi:predicted ATPase
MIHLRSIAFKPGTGKLDGFPFTVPFVRKTREIEFRSPVTFFVGENGSGKSTLLEAIAAGINAPAIGGEDIDRDESLAPARKLSKQLTFAWNCRTPRSLFLRAEDFFNFTKRLQVMHQELDAQEADYEQRMKGYGLMLAKGVVIGSRAALVKNYGKDLDANSHGEAFLKLFQARFTGDGLYLLDEPEAPLSPLRQLGLLSMMKEMVAKGAQFLIATHSPILMAFPKATILSFDDGAIKAVRYEDLEHVTLTKAFLNDPQNFLRRL